MKVVINRCFGGFGLSEKAFERLIALGVPARPYIAQVRDEETGKLKPEPLYDSESIFDLDHPETTWEAGVNKESLRRLCGRFLAGWIGEKRTHPLLVQTVEELGDEANGRFARLVVVEVPDGIDFEINEYDGLEHVAEKHRVWP